MIVNMNGGLTGDTLTVTAPAGVTVTVSKDGKTKTKVSDSSGVAVFKGLETGEWTVTITDGEQTAQKTVTITADYETGITFFAATINITYPEGSTCTATDGVTTLSAPDTSGTWECVVPNAGSWSITVTDGDNSETDTVAIDTDNQEESVTLMYWDGSLFDSGNQYEDVTGGWWQNPNIYYGFANTGTVTLGTTITISGGSNVSSVAVTKNRVNLDRYSTLHVQATSITQSYHFGVMLSDSGNADTDCTAAKKVIATTGITSLDLSGITGDYYIWIAAQNGRKATISKVWLE